MNNIIHQEKFIELLEPLFDKLFMYALSLEKNKEAAEDLVSEAILASYEAFGNLEDYDSFKAYLFKTARNIFMRKAARKWFFGKYDESRIENVISFELSPLLTLEIEILYKALDKIPAKQKEAIVLFEISGFSQKEICQIQSATLSALKSRINRGKENLKLILTKQERVLLVEKDFLKTTKSVML